MFVFFCVGAIENVVYLSKKTTKLIDNDVNLLFGSPVRRSSLAVLVDIH